MTRLARDVSGTVLLGDEGGFVPLSAAASGLNGMRDALRAGADGSLKLGEPTANAVPESAVRFAEPVADPGKLWGIGLNYAEHAADLYEVRPDEPASFMKPSTALTGPGGPIRLPPREQSERVTAEAEIGVVIGRTAKNVERTDVNDVIAGYVPIIDMTAEDILERNPRFLTRSKSFDSFVVVGPWIETGDVDDLHDVGVETVVNGDVRARNTVSNMLFPPRELVAFHSRVMTLEPGDIISTGTPGAHPIEPGDEVTAAVDQVGAVSAKVVRE
jgi:2-keto-4-pentenoate hydratase/2-oxohepta-3-ene-1,7-dioic acid hydratase in catechol pathway